MNVLTERAQARDHPLCPRFGVHGDRRSGGLSKSSQSPSEAVGSLGDLLVGDPAVVSEGELLEQLSVLLYLSKIQSLDSLGRCARQLVVSTTWPVKNHTVNSWSQSHKTFSFGNVL